MTNQEIIEALELLARLEAETEQQTIGRTIQVVDSEGNIIEKVRRKYQITWQKNLPTSLQ